MLGEQLIKNDQIALVELVKNSYDADATKVTVDFRGFGEGLESSPASSIVITDNGTGMGADTLRRAWMSPATPEKLRRKIKKPVTPKGRILQGEKGIGRFAVFKLGSSLKLKTRSMDSDVESCLQLDISDDNVDLQADSFFILPDNQRKAMSEDGEKYLDQISAELIVGTPSVFVDSTQKTHGTQITISKIRSDWSLSKAKSAFSDLERLQPIMWRASDTAADDFTIEFLADGKSLNFRESRDQDLGAILEHAVLSVTDGVVDLESREIRFDLNNRNITLSLDSPEIRGLRPFRDRFGAVTDEAKPEFSCGTFGFEFYVFDISNAAPSEYKLDRQEISTLRDHRIYLYRDGVRVYPYGDPDDDWLQIDVIRGTQSARSMFSNDQTVGFVAISQEHNPHLQDKTNREGLLEQGNATRDFVALIQTVLSYLRSKPYEQYAAANRRARERNRPAREQVDAQFDQLKSGALTLPAQQAVDQLQVAISREREIAEQQIARTQDLAGVGLSVETASHDLIAAGSESLRLAKLILGELRNLGLNGEHVYTLATSLVQRLEFIDSRFEDVQGLFVSSRKKRGATDVAQIARRVGSMYASMHRAKKIDFELDPELRLIVTTVESSAMQALINLVDNATFWLLASPEPRKIRIYSPAPNVIAVSDNGPGVAPGDEPYIFEPFYSGKGDAGKGLGLYIAREAGARSGFAIDLASSSTPGALDGATFTMSFTDSEEKK
jgi:signal transduction histidine kinase